jgi:ribosomal protein L4
MILPEVLTNLVRASRNLKGVKLIPAASINTYKVLKAKKIVFLPESVEKLKEVFLKK